MPNELLTPVGCQCGAVRFRVEGTLDDASVCHCRMCQKAFGGFYAPLVSAASCKADVDARLSEDVSVVELRVAWLLPQLAARR